MNRGNLIDCRKTILLKVHSYKDKQPMGTIHAIGCKTIYSFKNLTQLLVSIDDIVSTPATQTISKEDIFALARSHGQFRKPDKEKVWLPDKSKSVADFRIDIHFRKFGAWQGEMTCMHSGNKGAFRSVIEMALMLDYELEDILNVSPIKEAEV